MLTKEDILEEIRRTAKENGGTPLGAAQTSTPNFGLAVCAPAGQTQTEDNGTLSFLGLTPPGNP